MRTVAETGLAQRMPRQRDADSLRWARFLASTEAEGPGRRAALWVQGCDVRCPGCFNPQLWADRGATVENPADAAERFVAAALAAGVRGVTLLGGEPFDQAGALAVVARAFRGAGLTVMTFTGYRFESLREWALLRPDIADLLEATDLLADGPYLVDRPDSRRPWIGSTNQGLRALTPAYADVIRRVEAEGGEDRIEVRISTDGSVAVNGWAPDSALAELLDDLGVRGDHAVRRERRKEMTR